MTVVSISEESVPVQTKTCAGCGATFARPPGMWNCKWATRKHCRLDCRKTIPVEVRFRARVDSSGGPDACWLWMASRDSKGYGKFGDRRIYSPALAHRFAWELANGPIPKGLLVRHTCDNPPCVNPKHLEVGTYEDNANDMVIRGRSGLAKLNVELVQTIRRRLSQGERRSTLAREFGVDRATIGRIDRQECWRSILEE